MPRYDVFIAYAGPNAPHARELYEALAESLGKERVFFDREALRPGVAWQQEIPAALADSRITVALLARAANRGWYDKSEFIIAIDEVRRGDHVLIPVFVDGMPERMRDWPYGLQNLNAIDAAARGGLGPATAWTAACSSATCAATPAPATCSTTTTRCVASATASSTTARPAGAPGSRPTTSPCGRSAAPCSRRTAGWC